MMYIDLFNHLKEKINYDDDVIEVDENIIVKNFSFSSKHRDLLPGGENNLDTYEYSVSDDSVSEPDIIQELIHKTDAEIAENINFRYHVMMPKGTERAEEIILMFHGFNEKYWAKYLPWAHHVVKQTGKTVVMFPIAFHMNRAPALWSDTRAMYSVSGMRKKTHPDIICSSLSNVAISSRLNNKPQRFIWSGFQTYYDIIDLVEDIKADKHSAICSNASIDFISYSIGTFLGEIIMMTNHKGYFSQSKYATFCGGPVFNRLSPVSKFILDSEANVALYSFVIEHLESHIKRDAKLREFFTTREVGRNFARMLNYNTEPSTREFKFQEFSDRVYAIALKEDKIIPFYEVMNTLQGAKRDIPIQVDVLDYPYKYIHEDPFPSLEKIKEQVDEQFRLTFDRISNFLK